MKPHEGTVSILLPTYNRCRTLERALKSILDQTHQRTLAIVCDNASEDDTECFMQDLIAREGARIRYYRHSQNIGMVNNFNFALTKCDTPFFGFLSDDDFFTGTFVQEAMQAFNRYPEIKISALSMPAIDAQGSQLDDQLSSWPREGVYAAGEHIATAARSWPIISGCLFRAELLPELTFDNSVESMADVLVMIRLLARYPFFLSKKKGDTSFAIHKPSE